MTDAIEITGLPPACRPPMHYNDLIRQLAAELDAALRANVHTGQPVSVRYWPAIPMRPGLLFVSTPGKDAPPDPYTGHRYKTAEARVVPSKLGPWESRPYATLYGDLWNACRCESILGPGDEV
jgi:hypothetical protein